MTISTIITEELLDECRSQLDEDDPNFLIDAAQYCMIHVIQNHPQSLTENFDLDSIKQHIAGNLL